MKIYAAQARLLFLKKQEKFCLPMVRYLLHYLDNSVFPGNSLDGGLQEVLLTFTKQGLHINLF